MATRRLDVASLILMLVGFTSGYLSWRLVTERDFNALILVPSVMAVATGSIHITKRTAPRDTAEEQP
jgi:hypothetical protein